jgi:hypothetical protein
MPKGSLETSPVSAFDAMSFAGLKTTIAPDLQVVWRSKGGQKVVERARLPLAQLSAENDGLARG